MLELRQFQACYFHALRDVQERQLRLKRLVVRWECAKCEVRGQAAAVGLGKRPTCWNCGSSRFVRIL